MKYQRPILFLFVILSLFFSYYFFKTTNYHDLLENGALLKAHIESLGQLGPIIIIGLMTIAIVMSPLPSAPIALASGAIYGHGWGSLYVLIGSELGAIIAFLIARLLGYDIIQRWFGARLATSWVGSQNTLMGIIFFSRLLPFVSFDIVSYIAGLTSISFWRFAIATLAGIAPASFLLGHFGSELSSSDAKRMALAILGLGAFVAIPFIYQRLKRQRE